MTRRRRLLVLAGVWLVVASFSSPAWAHPGHDSLAGTPARASVGGEPPDHRAEEGTAESRDALGRHSPPPAALVLGALALLAALPDRRRVLGCVLVVLLTMVSLEGVLHAALHLHHVQHADSLAIGVSPAQQAAAGLDTEGASATPVILLSEVVKDYDAPVPNIVVSSSLGRAPPTSPA
jgi:hypothetical protein